jgi:hypothetical protein
MTPTPRFTLKDLPGPAKLVVSVFLVTVGLGYFSALVQLHMQHSSRNGEPLPSPTDVVEIFAGVTKYDPATAPAAPVSKLEKLVMGPIENAPWNGSGSMAGAFFHKSEGDYRERVKDPADKVKVIAEREGERLAVQSWIRMNDADRKTAYTADSLGKPTAIADISPDYLDKSSIKIKTLLTDRCTRCHQKGEDQGDYPLETYEHFAKYMDTPKIETPAPGSWIRSDRQVSIEKLTQSTHAHLLSFAMLFALTGLTFAFTGYPLFVRLMIAPIVLMAQVADISCWWLARIDGIGPTFAMAIIGTGSIVGLGLVVQILGSLFDMWGRKGRMVLIAVGLVAAAAFGALFVKVIEPGLAAEKAARIAVK